MKEGGGEPFASLRSLTMSNAGLFRPLVYCRLDRATTSLPHWSGRKASLVFGIGDPEFIDSRLDRALLIRRVDAAKNGGGRSLNP
jgi:hypothetical protein